MEKEMGTETGRETNLGGRSLTLTQSSLSSKVASHQEILRQLLKLAAAMGTEVVEARLRIYCEELRGSGITEETLAMACAKILRGNKFYPVLGEIFEAAKNPFDDPPRASVINGRPTPDGHMQPWGGACGCDECRRKSPRVGFYKATREDINCSELEREEVDRWFKSQADALPRVNRGESVADYRIRIGKDRRMELAS